MPGECRLTLKGVLNKPINIEIFNREVKKALKLEMAD
jgi:hypothetical protein